MTKRKVAETTTSPVPKRRSTRQSGTDEVKDNGTTQNGHENGNGIRNGKKKILLNAFDMSTVGHLSPGQWKVRPLPSIILSIEQ